MRYLKKLFPYASLSILTLLVLSTLFLVGCEKDEIITDSSKQDFSEISDINFNNFIKDIATIEDDVEINTETKELIINHLKGYDIENIKELDLQIQYDKKRIDNLKRGKEIAKDLIKNIENDFSNVESQTQSIDKDTEFENHLQNLLQEDYSDRLKNNNIAESRTRYNGYGYTWVRHMYEMDKTENPQKYYWCGQTCLKIVAEKHGQNKSLNQIHQIMKNNSSSSGYKSGNICPNARGKYCSGLFDLYMATDAYSYRNNQHKDYNYYFPKSQMIKFSDADRFFDYLKLGADYNKPFIVPSWYGMNRIAHFYVVVGYVNQYHRGKVSKKGSFLLLRDVLRKQPNSEFGGYFDELVQVDDFYNAANGNQFLIVNK